MPRSLHYLPLVSPAAPALHPTAIQRSRGGEEEESRVGTFLVEFWRFAAAPLLTGAPKAFAARPLSASRRAATDGDTN